MYPTSELLARLTCSDLFFPVENWTDLNAKKSTRKLATKNTRKRNERGTIHPTARKNPVNTVRRNITETLTRLTQMKGREKEKPKRKKKRKILESQLKEILEKSTNSWKILRGIDYIEKDTRLRTDITVRHTDTLKITRHTDTLMLTWMSGSVTVKPTKNRGIPGQTDITARHTDREMIRHTGNPGTPANIAIKLACWR